MEQRTSSSPPPQGSDANQCEPVRTSANQDANQFRSLALEESNQSNHLCVLHV